MLVSTKTKLVDKLAQWKAQQILLHMEIVHMYLYKNLIF